MLIRDDLTRPQSNNLTLVRLILASAVILTHCFEMIHGRIPKDALIWPLGRPVSELAVDGFFFLSGFLVYDSLGRSTSVLSFLKRRVVRMWPGLAVSVILTVAIGAMVSVTPIPGYFFGATASFLFGNLTFSYGGYQLTGVACGDALCVVNGSLWSLPWEFRCYLVLALLGFTGFAQRRRMIWFVLPATLAFALAWHLPGLQGLVGRIGGSGLLFVFNTWDRLWPLFALGAAAAIFRERIPLSWAGLLALVALNAVAEVTGFKALHIQALMVGYAVLCLGFLTADKRAISGRWPDYSFGIYIYAFPVMVALDAIGFTDHYLLLAGITLACTVPLAAFSWHMVEKPVLDRMHRARKVPTVSPSAI